MRLLTTNLYKIKINSTFIGLISNHVESESKILFDQINFFI